MGIADVAVRRRIAMLMLSLVVALFGVIALTRLGLDFFPELEYPMVSVVTSYGQASSEEVEDHITKHIEEVVSTVKNVKSVRSISSEGLSIVQVEFNWGTNLDFAAQDIREKIGLIEEFLPEEADKPLVVKFNPADMPVMVYACTGMENTQVLRDFLDDVVKPRLERLEGVASAIVMGGLEKEIQVLLHRDRLEAHGVSVQQVINALRGANLNLSGGHIIRGPTEYSIRVVGKYKNLDQIKNTVVGFGRMGYVRIRDIADVRLGYKEQRDIMRCNKVPGVVMAIMKQSGANTATVTDRIKAEVERMFKEGYIPKGVKMYPLMDQGHVIHRITSNAISNAVVGAILAVIFLFVFLLNWRPTFAIAVAIPLSVLATFFILWAMDYTLNMVTIMGLALCVGMMVDCSVVVIENIFRHLEAGKNRFEAARIGTKEVILAVTASTFTNMAVFIPLMIVPGITAQVARPLSVTVCVGIFMSLVVAVTLVPAIAATLFRQEKGRRYVTAGKIFTRVREVYKNALRKALAHRWKVIFATFALFCLSIYIAFQLGMTFMPESDVPVLVANVRMPVGTPLSVTDEFVRKFEEAALAQPEVKYVGVMIGRSRVGKQDVATGWGASDVHEAIVFTRLVDKEERKRTSAQIREAIRKLLPKSNAKVTFRDMSTAMLQLGSEAEIEIKVLGKDLSTIERLCKKIYERVQGVEGLVDIDHTFREGKPELVIRPRRDKAEEVGLPVAMIADLVTTAAEGKVATIYRVGGEEIDIRVRMAEEDRDSIDDIAALPVASVSGNIVHLGQIADLTLGRGPVKIRREDQIREGKVLAGTYQRDLASIMADIKKIVAGIKRPAGYFVEYGGSYELMQETFFWLAIAFVVAAILVYMIMAAQFESLSHPFIVMFTVPMGVIGAVFGLAVIGAEVSMIAMLGLVVLAGIVVNNAIVMIDFVNQLKARGLERHEALIEGAALRLRPILITSLTTILGMVPMALSQTQGHEMRNPFGAAVAGGLLFAMVLTLFVIPCIYSIVDHISFKVSKMAREIVHGKDEGETK